MDEDGWTCEDGWIDIEDNGKNDRWKRRWEN